MIHTQVRSEKLPIHSFSNGLKPLPRPHAMLNVIEFVFSGMMSQQQAYNDLTRAVSLFVEENIDLHKEIIAPAIATIQADLQGKPITFFIEVDPALPHIKADKRRIMQVILNLLSNAVQFTEEGSITLRVIHRHNDILFAVIDTGSGMKAETQAVILENTANYSGGKLSISKRVVEAHGGQLWLKSQYGYGAAFYFTLPIEC